MKTDKTHRITVPPRSVGEAIHSALGRLALDGPLDGVVLHAQAYEFATPPELCGIRATVELAAQTATSVHILCPERTNVHAYLSRMNVYRNLPPNVTLSRPAMEQERTDRSKALIELSHIQDADTVTQLMGDIDTIVSRQFDNSQLGRTVARSLGVVCENVLDHARAPIHGLVAAQRYPDGVELSIVDIGRGIPESLADNPQHQSLTDVEAVELSLRPGVSSLSELGRGSGLPELVSLCRQLRGASLRILSGVAHVEVMQRRGRESVSTANLPVRAPGTWVYIRFRADAQFKEVA